MCVKMESYFSELNMTTTLTGGVGRYLLSSEITACGALAGNLQYIMYSGLHLLYYASNEAV